MAAVLGNDFRRDSTTSTGGNVPGRNGFTLIELLIVVAICGWILTGIIGSFISQQYSYNRQEKLAEVQQDLRAAQFFLDRDLRKFGYDPSEMSSAYNSTMMIARPAELRLAWDANENGMIEDNEIIRYALTRDGTGGTTIPDTSRDGIANSFPCGLGRQVGTPTVPNLQPVADNVQGLEFNYHLADGTSTTNCASQTDRENIRSIDVSILVRSSNRQNKYTDSTVYRTASGAAWGPFNDGYTRRMMICNIKCRNMGLASGS